MKYILIFLLLNFCLTSSAEKKKKEEVVIIPPRYEVTKEMRDPFVARNMEKKKDVKKGTNDDVSEPIIVKILGAMKGDKGQIIGVFNFGVLTVGKTTTVLVKGKEVEVMLKSLDMKSMEADLLVRNEILHITKIGGEK